MAGVPVVNTDAEADTLFTGTHKGADGGLVLRDDGKHFRSLGVDPDLDLVVYNDTDSSYGTITAADEDTVTCASFTGGTNNTWTNGDEYSIYKTSTKDSFISKHYTDKRFGRKVTNPNELTPEGYLLDDVDLDEFDREVFGPNQPDRRHD